MALTIYRTSAFPANDSGGNEAGVVLDADYLNDDQMQAIAALVGYSETAFLLKSPKADFKLRYFTPTTEVALCGHATIATFNLLRNLDKIFLGQYSVETNEGLVDIIIKEEAAFMSMMRPSIKNGPTHETLTNALDLPKGILGKTEIKLISTGIYEMFVPIKDLKSLHELNLDTEKIEVFSKTHDVQGIYFFTHETLEKQANAHGRNFLPRLGIKEESATGTASAALAVYMRTILNEKTNNFLFEQGDSMNKPSRIHVELVGESSQALNIYVGGTMRFIDTITKAL